MDFGHSGPSRSEIRGLLVVVLCVHQTNLLNLT